MAVVTSTKKIVTVTETLVLRPLLEDEGTSQSQSWCP